MIAIRDDDTSFWTSSQELVSVYGELLELGGKISLAVVPDSYQLVNPGDRTRFYISAPKRKIYENRELVNFLMPYVQNGQIEIMQHGYDHSYSILYDNQVCFLDSITRENIGLRKNVPFLPECIYKDYTLFKKELLLGREILEDTFKIKVKTFVPPSNAIGADIVEVIDSMGLNISGTILPTFNRKIDIYSIIGYTKKILWKFIDKKHKYPHVISYKNHKELVGHPFTPITNFEAYWEELNYCKLNNYDFVMATHYWEILSDQTLGENFSAFLKMFNAKDTVLLKNLIK